MATLAGRSISANGLGLMNVTADPSASTPDDVAFEVMRAALAAGATVWNVADFYGPPHANSLHLLARYFTAYPEDADRVIICVKTGIRSFQPMVLDCSPSYMREAVENAVKILAGKKAIDVFGPCRVDPNTPIEDTVSVLSELKKEGKINGIQLSEVAASTIRRAAKVAKIDMVEAEVSLWATDIFTNGVAETCAELGIVVTAHTPLGSGMLTGNIKSPSDIPEDSFKRNFPRFQADALEKNFLLVKELQKLAAKKGVTAAQLALAWVKSKGREGKPFIVLAVGARSVERVKENFADVELTPEELEEIEVVLEKNPVEGGRYPELLAAIAEY
ncbi:NADP-dependent oxidoreductase domain-containing protein [Cadophora sp. MPI-SDFR-AT-0126]|nr:NADP-dependent oxidoreductase domain-containing protein [Leotiomycetes sp. MPI-SDFR-AT-0126]